MITRLLRRLQGHAPPGTVHASGPPAELPEATARVRGETLPPAVLDAAFVRHLLGTAPGAPMVPGLAGEVLGQLGAHCERLDVARLPRLPALVPQLLAAMRRDDVDATALSALLSRDATLAGEVMRVANSAYYRRARAAASLQQAVGILGNDGLRYVVLTSVMRPILHADPSHQGAATGARLAAQAEARTWLCGALALPANAGESQLASVIASAGLAALLRMMPPPLLAQSAADDALAPRLLHLAAELSARAAAHWRLGEPLQRALQELASRSATSATGRTLSTADQLAMLHELRRGSQAGEETHIADTVADRERHARLLAALGATQVAELAA